MQSRCTDAFNRDSYNLNFFIFNCTNCTIDDQATTNAILPLLNIRNRKRPLSEVFNGINEFHSNKRLKITRSGGITAGKYRSNNNSNHNNNRSSPTNYTNNISPPPNNYIQFEIPSYYDSTSTNNFSSFESENKQSNESSSPSQPIASHDIYQSKSKNRLGRKKKLKNKNENKNQSKNKNEKNVENQSFEWHPWLATIIEKLERDKIKKTKKKKKKFTSKKKRIKS